MIRNNRKSNSAVPSSLLNAADELERIANGEKELINPSIYKGEYKENGKTKYEIRDALKEIYYNKCAYCETKEFKPEIEHYRPKGRVTGLKKHPGYYWLCYEWTNLLPSCRYCNTEGGKGNQFPIKGHRVSKPAFTGGKLDKSKCKADRSPLKDEHPFLLHPEIDSPENFFAFKRNGKIEGTDKGERGKRTIKICNLNRENLLDRRQKIVDDIRKKIEDAFLVYFDVDQSADHLKKALKQIFTRMEAEAGPENEFSLMALYCFNHFTTLIVPLLATPNQREIATKAFTLYKAGR